MVKLNLVSSPIGLETLDHFQNYLSFRSYLNRFAFNFGIDLVDGPINFLNAKTFG